MAQETAATQGISEEPSPGWAMELWLWWEGKKRELRVLTKLVADVALVLPASADAERVFSVMNNARDAGGHVCDADAGVLQQRTA